MDYKSFLNHEDIRDFDMFEIPFKVDPTAIPTMIYDWLKEFDDYYRDFIEVTPVLAEDLSSLTTQLRSIEKINEEKNNLKNTPTNLFGRDIVGAFQQDEYLKDIFSENPSQENSFTRTGIMQLLYKIGTNHQQNDNCEPKPITARSDGVRDFSTNIRIKCFMMPLAIDRSYHQCYLRLGIESFAHGLFNYRYSASLAEEWYNDYYSNDYVNSEVESPWDVPTSNRSLKFFEETIQEFKAALFYESNNKGFTQGFSSISPWLLMGIGLCMYKLNINSYTSFIEKSLLEKDSDAFFYKSFGFSSWEDIEKRIL